MMYVAAVEGVPGPTFKVTATNDNAVSFSAAQKTHEHMGNAKGAFIVCEGYACRVSFGGTTSTSSVGVVLSPGDSLYVKQWKWVDTASFINKTAGENFTIQVTMEF
jgi:hypothetical protein